LTHRFLYTNLQLSSEYKPAVHSVRETVTGHGTENAAILL